MPTYFNPNQDVVQSRGVTIPPRTTVATNTNLDLTTAVVWGTAFENFSIEENRNDKLYLKFNDDRDWMEITLTAAPGSPGATAQDIADDINNDPVMIEKGYSDGASPTPTGVASVDSPSTGQLILTAPTLQPYPPGSPAPSPWTEPARTSRIYVRPSPAALMLGLPVSVQSPIKESFPTLILIDNSPTWSPIIFTSGTVAGGTYTLQRPDEAAYIKITCTVAPCSFRINDILNPAIVMADTASPPITLPSDGRIEIIHHVAGSFVVEEMINTVGP